MRDMPCDACGKDTGCTCPPCPCKWCRYERGEATAEERHLIEAHIRAHEAARRRQFVRGESMNMRARFDAYVAGTKH